MQNQRMSGILLHPTSFYGSHGVGELGKAAYEFIDFMEKAGQKLWQILPLGPTGYGDSPYASFSTFAGNPLLIDLDSLVVSGFLTSSDLRELPAFDPANVDYGWVQWWKIPLLEKAAKKFLSQPHADQVEFDKFCKEEADWLDDFALFMAVKEVFQKKAEAEKVTGKMWSNYWDKDIRLKEPEAVEKWKKSLSLDIEIKKVLQFWFFKQWLALKTYANKKNIKIIGDIPIFVAPDSVDVWANRKYFKLDKEGQPLYVAGVPPDYFSATGQLWGNPIYNWSALEKDDFSWWLKRVKNVLRFVDIIRIDHFRGFEAYWEIPFGSENAINGKWVKAPGKKLFTKIREELGQLPILAEDLGLITKEVEELRDHFQFPGMKILQFAFDSQEESSNSFLPHNHIPNCVVYTGSHDNDTARGWLEKASEPDRQLALRYINARYEEGSWAFIRAAIASCANTAIIPYQDLLNLSSYARMNTPSTLGNNWAWRLIPGQMSDELARDFRSLCHLYGRI